MCCKPSSSALTVSTRRPGLGCCASNILLPTNQLLPKRLWTEGTTQSCAGRQAIIAAGVKTVAPTHAASHAVATSHDHHRAVTPSQVAEELHCYAVAAAAAGCRLGSGDAFLATCLRELSSPHRLRRLRPRQIASILRSLVRLGAHPGDDWLAELDFACYCHPGPFDPASATAVLRYLAALHTAAAAPASQPTAAAPLASTAAAVALSSPRAPSGRQQQHQPARQQLAGASSSAAATAAASSSTSPAPTPPASFRFPHAVHLRLLQGGASKYTYEQLAMLLQSFRRLGVAVDDELALAVGRQMAVQLAGMAPGRRAAALRMVLGGAAGTGTAAAAAAGPAAVAAPHEA